MMSSSGQPVTYLVRKKQVLSHPNCICVIQMNVAKTMWYLQFHVVCDKVCTSFNGLLFIICPPFDFYAVARPHSYSIKRSFIFKGSSLKLYGTPRLSGGFLIQKSHSPFMNDPFP